MEKNQRVFIIFSNRDRKLKEDLVTRIEELRQEAGVSDWNISKIKRDEDYFSRLEETLSSATLLIVLGAPGIFKSPVTERSSAI